MRVDEVKEILYLRGNSLKTDMDLSVSLFDIASHLPFKNLICWFGRSNNQYKFNKLG